MSEHTREYITAVLIGSACAAGVLWVFHALDGIVQGYR
jgi:hypothetical protein